MSSEGNDAHADGDAGGGAPADSSDDSTRRAGDRVVNTGDGYERVDGAPAERDEGDGGETGSAGGDEEDLGRAGWVLVAVVVIAFLVVPGIIYVRPTAPSELGFRFLAAMLVLPFVPALLLGITAVWSLAVGGE
ncbi:hypothetical protein Hbl1158_12975 [Halobaculum sp. CBA1158]|uniref:hypothetical protein n=1 Tax=Halobaculum sp. CBA1158 TaxID=2904243 RepID=UPI001F27B8A6|nr:hypothetical protein [Halobaculum sp. CBA1158]UIO99427.1 hypothetical protein Hbl1158_12975 [Halobaculum sp. CBA1158]